MRLTRFIAILLLLGAGTAQAAESEDWSTFGRVLSLMQGFIQIAAQSQGDPKRVDRHVEGLLSGSNANANKLAEEVFADMPGEQRGQVLDLARQIAVLGQQLAAMEPRQTGDSVAVQARKDLAGMGMS